MLIIINAKTKCFGVIPVPNTTSTSTITILYNFFAYLELPESLVSDNGLEFSRDEFTYFLWKNGIMPIKMAPYHPNSNGLVEIAVSTEKSALKKIKEGTFMERLTRFLLSFRNIPSGSTGISSVTAMFGCPL